MEFKYQYAIYIGLGVAAVLLILGFLKFRKKDVYKGGKKLAGFSYVKQTPYFKKRMMLYKILQWISMITCAATLVAGCVVLARPYKTRIVDKKTYCRDIILCIDISSSVDYLNENLVSELRKMVEDLEGERFGIVIFNTSPVLLTPLTDDYKAVTEQLTLLEKCLKARVDYLDGGDLPADWSYLFDYISSGTLVGSDERGSSLIGDGLASAVYDFSDLEQERTRIIIFSTDNDLQGTPLVSISEAADICVRNNVTVYGIGTKEMYTEDRIAMKASVEKTGGSFFLEEESGTFKEIVKEISQESASLVDQDVEIRKVDVPKNAFVWLFSLSIVFILVSAVIRR